MKFLNDTLNILFPPKCVLCNKTGQWLCINHDTPLKPATSNHAQYKYLDNISAQFSYSDPKVQKCIKQMKFRFSADIADFLVQKTSPQEINKDLMLVPVPMHWTRRLERGFNQSEKIAQALVRENPELEIKYSLKKIKKTKRQSQLTKAERAKNNQNAFRWKGATIPEKVCLVDDVVASGATLDAAAAYLKSIGVKEVHAWVLARGGA